MAKQKLTKAQRAATDKLLSLEKTANKFENTALLKAYQMADRAVSEKINAFYGKYATANKVSYQAATVALSNKEKKTAQAIIAEYYGAAKKAGVDSSYLSELKKLSAKAEITRLQALQCDIKFQIEILNNKNLVGFKELESELYTSAYYKEIFNETKYQGLTGSFSRLDTRKITAAVNKGYNGVNYSDSLYNNKNKLLQTLNQQIPQAFITGSSVEDLARVIRDDLNTSYNASVRLARTETNRLNNESALDVYRETMSGDEYVEVLATLDSHTCEICAAMDGQLIPLSEAVIGSTIPPFHPNDRCTTIRYFSGQQDGKRLASIDGQWEQISDMSFADFYNALESGEDIIIK